MANKNTYAAYDSILLEKTYHKVRGDLFQAPDAFEEVHFMMYAMKCLFVNQMDTFHWKYHLVHGSEIRRYILPRFCNCERYLNSAKSERRIMHKQNCTLYEVCPYCESTIKNREKRKLQAKLTLLLEKGKYEPLWLTVSLKNTNNPLDYATGNKIFQKINQYRKDSLRGKGKKDFIVESIAGIFIKHEFTISSANEYNHHFHMLMLVEKKRNNDMHLIEVGNHYRKLYREFGKRLFPERSKIGEEWYSDNPIIPRNWENGKHYKLHNYFWQKGKEFSNLDTVESVDRQIEFFMERRRARRLGTHSNIKRQISTGVFYKDVE